ncbi:MAG: ABC transporter transmembrane domain-containing protein, partial [Acutalibacteraceae bacterium]
MRTVLKFLKKYRKEAVLSPLFKLLEACFELFVPLVVASLIDKGIAKGNNIYIVKMCLLLVILGALGLCFAVTAQYFAAKAAVGSARDMRSSLFERINKFSFSQLDSLGISTLITRITGDVNAIQGGINTFLRLLLRSPFIVFGAMIM